MNIRHQHCLITGLYFAFGLILIGCSGDTGGSKPASNSAKDSATSNSATDADSKSAASEITLKAAQPDDLQKLIATHKGKVVLVDFWATWCAPCRKQFPHTVELSRKHAADGFAAISVSCDDADRDAEILAFLKKSDARFDNIRSKFGGDEETFTAFEIEGGALPHYKLYDRTGKLRHTFGTDPTADKQFTPEDIDVKVAELLEEKN